MEYFGLVSGLVWGILANKYFHLFAMTKRGKAIRAHFPVLRYYKITWFY